jgi:hypothetical protein
MRLYWEVRHSHYETIRVLEGTTRDHYETVQGGETLGHYERVLGETQNHYETTLVEI